MAKRFHVPGPRAPATIRARLRNPMGRTPGRYLEVFRDLSFDVEQGEFFGVVGRNGSGKSTLLKLLASVYGADHGSIRVAGRMAPFLELGVGFNPKLTARDNVVLNAVMMGLSPTEARRRFDEVIEFAGLQDYVDLQVKNYSSGMKVRLGFAVMTHVDADVLLIDEVLAVGDAEFQERCGDVFERMHAEGRTILLVTHSMPIVTQYCERALLAPRRCDRHDRRARSGRRALLRSQPLSDPRAPRPHPSRDVLADRLRDRRSAGANHGCLDSRRRRRAHRASSARAPRSTSAPTSGSSGSSPMPVSASRSQSSDGRLPSPAIAAS